MNKYTPIHTHAQLVEALRRGLTVEINTKDNESAADYQAPQPCGWVSGLPAVTIAADDPDSYAWQGFTFRAVGEHDLSPAQPETPALTNADLSPGSAYRACYWTDDRVAEVRLTGPEHAHLPPEELITSARAEAEKVGLDLSRGRLVIGDWTD